MPRCSHQPVAVFARHQLVRGIACYYGAAIRVCTVQPEPKAAESNRCDPTSDSSRVRQRVVLKAAGRFLISQPGDNAICSELAIADG